MGVCLTLYPVRVEAIIDDDVYSALDDAEPVDFDKAWHMVHYLLTGSADATDNPLGILFESGKGVEDVSEDVHVLSPDQMRAFREALAQISDVELRQRYDPASMARSRVYLADAFADGDPDEGWDYVAEAIPDLRTLADNCANNGLGALAILA